QISSARSSSAPHPSPLAPSSFLFDGAATPQIYTLSLHDALPIYRRVERSLAHAAADLRLAGHRAAAGDDRLGDRHPQQRGGQPGDRKSTRLNSSHVKISYAVFCLKKKKEHGYRQMV